MLASRASSSSVSWTASRLGSRSPRSSCAWWEMRMSSSTKSTCDGSPFWPSVSREVRWIRDLFPLARSRARRLWARRAFGYDASPRGFGVGPILCAPDEAAVVGRVRERARLRGLWASQRRRVLGLWTTRRSWRFRGLRRPASWDSGGPVPSMRSRRPWSSGAGLWPTRAAGGGSQGPRSTSRPGLGPGRCDMLLEIAVFIILGCCFWAITCL